MHASRSPIFFVLAGIFVTLIVAIVFGLLYTSRAFPTTLRPGGGLLDGLIANGISVVVSVILISPLTAYFISRRREQQLAPVQKSFVETMASEIDRLAAFYIHQAPLYGNAILALETSLSVNTLSSALEAFNLSLRASTDRVAHVIPTAQQALATDSVPAQDSVLTKAMKEAALIREMTADLYETFYKETISLENTVSFSMPLFPVEMVTNLHDIRKTLIEYRGSLQDMLSVLSGAKDPRITAMAKQSALDFGLLIHKVQTLATASGVAGDISDRMTSATAMDGIGVRYQRDIAGKLVEIFVQARDYDAKIDQLRRSA